MVRTSLPEMDDFLLEEYFIREVKHPKFETSKIREKGRSALTGAPGWVEVGK
jgi:hypothetical protein